MKRFIIFCFCLFLTAFSYAQDHAGAVPSAEVAAGIDAQGQFALDGNFSPEKYGMSTNVVFSVGRNMKITGTDTTWGVYRDADRFIIGCSAPTGGELIAFQKLRDGSIWTDDSIEIYLLDKDCHNGFHFIFNSGIGLFDATLTNGAHDAAWNAREITVKNVIENGIWKAEFSIPLKELGPLAEEKDWKIGLYRSAQGKRDNESIGQNRNISYYDKEAFVCLHWDDTLVPYSYTLDMPALLKGKLAGTLTLPKDNQEVEWQIGASPLNFAANDAYNGAIETLKANGVAKAGQTHFALDEELPQVGTIRMTLLRNGRKFYERLLPYDLQQFSQFKISAIWATMDKTQLCVDMNCTTPGNYDVTLVDKAGKTATASTGKIASSMVVMLPLAGVAPGDYTLHARLMDSEGKELQHDSGAFTAIDAVHPEWMDNSLGKTNGAVPPPWTPVQITDGCNVRIWGRTYALNAGGLPTTMTGVAGIAAEACRFVADGRAYAPESFRWVKQAADEAVFESTLTLPQARLRVKGTVEFDGLMWLELQAIPEKNQTVPALDFCFEVPAENSTLVYSGEHGAKDSGTLPPEKGWSKDLLHYVPMFWLGNDHGGMGFFVDELVGWNLKDYTRTVEISPVSDDRRHVVVHLLDAEMNRPDTNYRLEFALQVTPVKTMPKGWRTFQINGGLHQNLHFYGRCTEMFNAPMPLLPTAQDIVEADRQKGITTSIYLAFNALSPFVPEFPYFSEDWRMMPQQRPGYQKPDDLTHSFVCMRGKGFTDYYLYRLNQLIDTLKPESLYFDYSQPSGQYKCANPNHGCEWVDNLGEKHSSIRMRASRECAKRIYTLFKQKNPNGIIVHHNSGGMFIPFHSFSDITWNGEQTTSNLMGTELRYAKILEIDKCRIEQRHEPWGVVVCFLPQYLRAVEQFNKNYFGDRQKLGWNGVWNIFNTEERYIQDTWFLAGLTLINDSMFSGDWGMWSRQEELTKIQEILGWDDSVEFYGYFNPANPYKLLSPVNQGIYVSAYKAPKGVLLVVFNDTNQEADAEISLPSGKNNWIDAIRNKQVEMKNERINLSIPGKGLRLLYSLSQDIM